MFRTLSSRLKFPLNRIYLESTQKRFIGKDHVVESPWVDVSIPEANLHDHIFQQFPKYGSSNRWCYRKGVLIQ